MADGEAPSRQSAEAFTLRIADIVGDSLVCMSVAMGIETGLFKAMISLGEEPKTSQEIADAGNFKER